jgi:hypothetical protein
MASKDHYIPVLNRPDFQSARGSGQIVQVVLNSDLRSGHLGLTKAAKGLGISTEKLEPGQYVVFVNTAQNRVKLYTSNQIIAYWKVEKGRRVDLNTLRLIPYAFRSKGSLQYDGLLRETLNQKMRGKS